ncbi:2437_t:CDS:2, partial [Dentiscutata erythropus]
FDFYREQADVKTVPKSYKEIGKTDSYNYLDLKLKLIVATSWESYTSKYNKSSIRKLDLSKSLEKDLLEIRKKRLNIALEKKDYVMNNIVKNLTECQDEKIYNSLLHKWEEKSFVVFEEFCNKNMIYKYKDYLSGKENNNINELFKTQYRYIYTFLAIKREIKNAEYISYLETGIIQKRLDRDKKFLTKEQIDELENDIKKRIQELKTEKIY